VSYHPLHSYWGTHTEKEMFDFLAHGDEDFTWNWPRHIVLGLSGIFAAVAVGYWFSKAYRNERRWRTSRPFFWAALVGLAANTALLGVTKKPVYGHYVQSLLPFYFVAFAELGRAAIGWKRGWWLVGATAVIVCAGGIDSALWTSNRLDARNGLWTMRRVIAAVEKDRPGVRSVSLGLGYRGSTWGFNVVSGLTPGHVFFGGGPSYSLLRKEEPAPPGAKVVLSTGPVVLYGSR
jgi:hypothetical protein